MFGKKSNTDNKSGKNVSSSPLGALNSIVQGTNIEGDIQSESDIRIDGTIKGNLKCSAKIIIGSTGVIEGEIHSKNAIIEGKFTGTLNVAELLNVKQTAEVSGEIYTNKLIVESGALFNVSCKMGAQHTKSSSHKPHGAGKEIRTGNNQAEKKAS